MKLKETAEQTGKKVKRTAPAQGSRGNRLAAEKSPYLLQHAKNPVDWHPWGEAAFAAARSENKPVFLSIGYSTCHWCHVMAHESFEDPDVARLLNDAFICIKVDREERPDLDNIYMRVCQMLTGSGGWPLTILMTPDQKPFFAGTYIPRETRYGRTGMLDLIPRIKEVWAEKQSEVLHSASQMAGTLQQSDAPQGSEVPGRETLQRAFEELCERFDAERGGFSRAPKFPTPHNLYFLLRHWRRTGDARALHMVEKSLQEMRQGGIYDHIGFGFHRYATDHEWLVPHFEKMLYDQALIAMACIEAYQATGKKVYAQTAHEIITYVLRDMTSPEGGFYSGEDADSEGREGKFYVWTEDELRAALLPDEAELIIRLFNIKKTGNFHDEATGQNTGANIFHLTGSFCESAHALKMTEHDLYIRFETVREKLFALRAQRVHPHKDDKVLTDWNGLMIAALARAAQVFDTPAYAAAAQKAASFILNNLHTPEGRLLHRYRDGEAKVSGMVDDYAFFIWGLIELYEATFETAHLLTALALQHDMLEHFWDDRTGGFYFTADDGEKLLVRQKEIYDGAVPSGNSAAMLNLVRLARITGRSVFEDKALGIVQAFAGIAGQVPSAYTQLMTAFSAALGPAHEIVIAGNPQTEDTRKMLRALRGACIPDTVVVLRPVDEHAAAITSIAPYTREQTAIDGKATAYVCRNHACSLPTTSIDKMLELLQADK